MIEIYGFKNYTEQHTQYLLQTLLPYAIENDNVINLMKLAINEIKIQKIILPGITTIEKHPNRIRQLSRLGSKNEPFSLRRFEEKKRYAILALYLYELSQNLIDKAIEIHDRQIFKLFF